MRYGFYQLHRALFEEVEVRLLRDFCLKLYSLSAQNSKAGFLKAFNERAENPLNMANLEGVLKWFWGSPFPGYFQALYRDEPALMIDFLTVRHHAPSSQASHVSWHADANFGGNKGPIMVCWVPLDPVGRTAPGLDFCLPLRKVDEDVLNRGWAEVIRGGENSTIGDADLDRLYGIGNHTTETHVLNVGDCYVFDRYTVHRTQRLQKTTTDRYAVEFRITSKRVPPRLDQSYQQMILSIRDHARNSIDILTGAQLYDGA